MSDSFMRDFDRKQRAAEKSRLKELGGRARTVAEEAEWQSLFLRGIPWNRSHFEERRWEKTAPHTEVA